MINYEKILTKKVQNIKPSGIRRFFDLAETMEGVISLGVGEPDFATPWSIRNEAINSLKKGRTYYTSNSGLINLRKLSQITLLENMVLNTIQMMRLS